MGKGERETSAFTWMRNVSQQTGKYGIIIKITNHDQTGCNTHIRIDRHTHRERKRDRYIDVHTYRENGESVHIPG